MDINDVMIIKLIVTVLLPERFLNTIDYIFPGYANRAPQVKTTPSAKWLCLSLG